jgi:hypothetical protein
LAREAASDDIDGNSIGSEALSRKRSNIVINGHLGPMFVEDVDGERLDLAERDSLESTRPLQAKVEPANAGEERKDFQLVAHHDFRALSAAARRFA